MANSENSIAPFCLRSNPRAPARRRPAKGPRFGRPRCREPLLQNRGRFGQPFHILFVLCAVQRKR